LSAIGELWSGLGKAVQGKAGARAPVPTLRYFEDPTVAQTAADEAHRLWLRIAQKVQGGVWFYQAREQVLAEEIPDIGKAYGRPVASRVEKAVQRMEPCDLPAAATAAVRAGNQAAARSFLRARDGRVSLINRLSLAWFGRHFW
jgi:hypothetical protein